MLGWQRFRRRHGHSGYCPYDLAYDQPEPVGIPERAKFSPAGIWRRKLNQSELISPDHSPQPKPIYPAGGDQPAVNPGSDTYPLDVSAALSDDRKTLTLAVLNPSDSEQRLNVAINGAKLTNQGHLWRMAPSSVDATITVGQKPGVEVQEQELTLAPDAMAVPPFSVSIYSFAVQ